jgi:hypothetical protein
VKANCFTFWNIQDQVNSVAECGQVIDIVLKFAGVFLVTDWFDRLETKTSNDQSIEKKNRYRKRPSTLRAINSTK